MNEAYREHPDTVWLVFNHSLHPIVIVGMFVSDNDYFTLLEGQFIVVVGRTVIQRPAPSQTTAIRGKRLAAWYRTRRRKRPRRNWTRGCSVRWRI